MSPFSVSTTLNTAMLEEPELEMPDLPEVDEEELQRRSMPQKGDIVKLTCTVLKLQKIFYAMVCEFPYFRIVLHMQQMKYKSMIGSRIKTVKPILKMHLIFITRY